MWSNKNVHTLLHEAGHLFGSKHTFTTGGITSYKTEPARGTSTMSYGFYKVDFFSLISVERIRHLIVNRNGYYSDEERTQKVGAGGDNTPYGIKTANRAPYSVPQVIRVQAGTR